MIDLRLTNESIDGLHDDLRALLAGASIGTIAAVATTAVTNTARPGDKPGSRPSGRTRAAAAEKDAAPQNISTGEERVDPETEKQDAADEAAEKPPEPVKLNHDSVRKMLGGYVMAFGMEAAQADGVALIGTAKISDLKDDQAAFAKAVIAIATGIEKNPHKREMSGDGITAEKLAELKPIVAAAMAAK